MLRRSKMLALILAVILLIPALTVSAAGTPRVIFNGNQIVYDVAPQIISGRTMVPIRATIETITGSQMGWDANTKTLSFSADGHYITHTIGQTVVYKDGAPVNFDTPSMILDNRTLVPIRMIAETSGCTVSWDQNNYLVIITHQAQPAPAPTPVPSLPAIVSVAASKTTIVSGDTSVLTVKTNAAASNVWVDDGRDNASASLVSTDTSGAKTWTVTARPSASRNVIVYANTSQTTTNAAYTQQYITVTGSAVSIVSVSTNKTTIDSGSSVTFTIRTNSQATNVWVEYDSTTANASRQSDYSNGDKSWSVTISPSNTQSVKVYANTSKSITNAASESQRITVNTAAYAAVQSVSANKTSVNSGDTVTITAVTNSAAQYCWAELEYENADMTYVSQNSSGNKTWTVTFTPYETTTVTVYASRTSRTGKDDSKSVKITVQASGPKITNVSVSPGEVPVSGDFKSNKFTITTNRDVGSVYFDYYGGMFSATQTGSTSSSITWTVTESIGWIDGDPTYRAVSNYGIINISVYAESMDGYSDSKTIDIKVYS